MAYSARTDIEARFGVENVKHWADLDSDADAGNITARITAAIADADALIDDEMRGGVYAVPFSTVPLKIKNCSANLAAVWLYKARPRSNHEEGKGFDQLEEDMMNYLKRVRRGQVRFDLAYEEIAPYVVKP